MGKSELQNRKPSVYVNVEKAQKISRYLWMTNVSGYLYCLCHLHILSSFKNNIYYFSKKQGKKLQLTAEQYGGFRPSMWSGIHT